MRSKRVPLLLCEKAVASISNGLLRPVPSQHSDLAEINRSARPRYTLDRTSKKTFRGISEGVVPYTIEVPRIHTINVLFLVNDNID
jgi:hypothetical protein